MILLDTSVLIDYLRSKDAQLLGLMRARQAAICGVTRAEVLRGARDAKQRAALLTILNGLPEMAFPGSLWDDAGDVMATLGASGITAGLGDALIAATALFHKAEVWTRDQHFGHMQAVLPALRLFQEPP